MIDEIKAILFGRIVAMKIIRQHPDVQMLFGYEAIGDYCFQLAFARAYQREKRTKRLAILTSKPQCGVFSYFQDAYDELIPISKNQMNILLKFYKSDMGQIFRKKYPQILCTQITAFVRNDLIFNNRYLRAGQLQKALYQIPLSTEPCGVTVSPENEWIMELQEKGILQHHRTVLLNPYAFTCKQPPMGFFEKLAARIQAAGYSTITSICGEQEAVRGTYGLSFELDKTIELANECGYVVGTRSGFMDLVAFSEAVLVSIDDPTYPLSDVCRLEDTWKQNSNIKSFLYQEAKETELIESILRYIFKE